MNGTEQTKEDGPSRSARALVLLAVVMLLVPGVVGFEAWPMTAWRLFSLSRSERQTVWVLEAATASGEARMVSLEELPLRFRHAAWPLSELPDASQRRREDMCQALLGATRDVVPDLTELRIIRDRQRLVRGPEGWVVTHRPEAVHSCAPRADR